MKKFRIILTMVMLSFTGLLFSTEVKAAPDIISQEDFDYTWYLQKHPDLAAIYTADNKEGIYNFYITTGEPNGWQGRASVDSYINQYNFNYTKFLAEHPDVLAAFGEDTAKIWNFYVTQGKNAGYKGYSKYEEDNAIAQIYTLADTVTAGCTSDYEKVKAVHDWIINRTSYDYDNYLAGTIPSLCYSPVGVIEYCSAVCQGYAETFEAFMDVLGIPCYMVTSSNHAWNRVKVGGIWYSIDTTWDDPIYLYNGYRQEVLVYDYFLIGEDQMNSVESHTPTQSSMAKKAKYEK